MTKEQLEKLDVNKAKLALKDLDKVLDSMYFTAPEVMINRLHEAAKHMNIIANSICLDILK